MGKIIKSGKWKPVDIRGVDFNDLDGLIGFEELTEYSFGSDRENETETIKIGKIKKKCITKHNKGDNKKNKTKKKALNNFVVEPSKIHENANFEDNPTTVNNLIHHIYAEEDTAPWTNIFVPNRIVQALMENGFKEPTEIQMLSIPAAVKGRRDILGAAQTGSGKTLAFGIPILYGIMKNISKLKRSDDLNNESECLDENELKLKETCDKSECVRVVNGGLVKKSGNKLWALILTPTRELAIQIKNHLVTAATYTDIKVAVIVGGMSAEKQQRILKKGPHIVVATPGRLWELISTEEHFSDISSIRYFAVDEADRMTEVNHFPELRSLLERINAVPENKAKRQNFVFSATLSLVHQVPYRLKKKSKNKKGVNLTPQMKLQNFIDLIGLTNPKIVDITNKQVVAENLTEACIHCTLEDKDLYLYYFLQCYPGRTLIFCNNISCVRRLASILNNLKCHPLPLHANMMQRQRLKNLDRFRDNADAVLLATDVAARGLDIPNVQHVIHYQVPRTSESYVHRSGRTARANEKGLTLLLIEPTEMPAYQKLCRTLNRNTVIPELTVNTSTLSAVKERILLAHDIHNVESKMKKQNSNLSWLEKAAKDMDIILDEDIVPEKMDPVEYSKIKKVMLEKRSKLNTLLLRKLHPKINNHIGGGNISSQGEYKRNSSAIEVVASSINTSLKNKKKNKTAIMI